MIYSYPDSAIIDEVTLRKAPSGATRAYLHLKASAGPDMVDAIKAHFPKGVSTSEHGRPEFELRNVRETKLIGDLKSQKWVGGSEKKTKELGDTPSFAERAGRQTLFGTSMLYFLGDYKFWSYGRKNAEKLDMAAGIAYGMGTLANLVFGSNPFIPGRQDRSDLQVQDMAQKMADHMNSQNLKIPEEAALQHVIDTHKKGGLKKFDDLARVYSAEAMHLFFAVAGAFVATAAYKKLNHGVKEHIADAFAKKSVVEFHANYPNTALSALDKHRIETASIAKLNHVDRLSNKLDIGLGSITFLSGLFGAFVKEKVPDPNHPPQTVVEKVTSAIQAHPLTISGIGLMVATMCHAVSTGMAWKVGATDTKSAIFDRGIFVATNLMAELLITISSKGHGGGVVSDASVDNTVMALAADMIAKEPPAQQNQLIEQVAVFLSRADTLALKDQDVKDALRQKVEALRGNPWAKAAPAMPAPSVVPAKDAIPAFQAKLALQDARARSMQQAL